jgi:hypothetical protein
MSDSLEIAEIADGEAWNELARNGVGGSVFSTHSWLESAQHASGGTLRCFGCFKSGRLVAGLSGMERSGGGMKQLATPVLTPHGGLIYQPIDAKSPAKLEADRNRATELLLQYVSQRYHHISLSHTPEIEDLRPFSWSGFAQQVRYTYRIRIADLEDAWEKLERRTRGVIRKAEDAGFDFKETKDASLIRLQYEQIYKKSDEPAPVSPQVVERFVGKTLDAGLAQAFAIESGGEVASVVVFVNGFGTVYAWVAGQNPDYSASGATSLLYWRFFGHTALEQFDFVGANMPSIALFKRGFGGDLTSYYAVERYRNSWTKAAFAARRLSLRLLGR